MKLKKLILVSAAIGLTSVVAQAQSDVGAAPSASAANKEGLTISNGPSSATLYGLIDVTLTNRNNVNAAGQSLTAPGVAWFSGNRWGITGARSLAGHDDLKAIFRLESEFESETGAMDTAGVIFNRDSWLGLQSKSLGKLTFGRQNALGRDPAASAVYGYPYCSPQPPLAEGGYSNNNPSHHMLYYSGTP